MKGGLLSGLYALRALRGARGRERRRTPAVRAADFVANPDEEIGSPSSTPLIREAAATADVCFVLEWARENGDIVSRRARASPTSACTINGRAAHAGVEPEKGRSAILEAAHKTLARCTRSTAAGRASPSTSACSRRARGPTSSRDQARARDRPARAWPRENLEAAEAAIRAIAAASTVPDATVDVERMAPLAAPMEKRARSGRAGRAGDRLAARLGFELRDAATGGASDANTTSGMGVPSLDGLGPVGGAITRRASTSRSTRSCRARRFSRRCCSSCRATRSSPSGGPRRSGREAMSGESDRGAGSATGGSAARRRISSGGPWEMRFGYSRAIVAGDTCHVSGTTDAGPTGQSLHPGDAAAQARAALGIIERALVEAGFACTDVVRTRMYLTDVADAAAVGAVHGEWFRDVRPASALVVVAALIDPTILVEIEVDATRG